MTKLLVIVYLVTIWFQGSIWHKYHEWYFKIVFGKFWSMKSGIYAKHPKETMPLFVYNIRLKKWELVGISNLADVPLSCFSHVVCIISRRPKINTLRPLHIFLLRVRQPTVEIFLLPILVRYENTGETNLWCIRYFVYMITWMQLHVQQSKCWEGDCCKTKHQAFF